MNWFNENTNLHKVWDELLIASTKLSFTEYATFLNRISEEEKDSYRGKTYIDWAKESKQVRGQVYDFGSQKNHTISTPFHHPN